MNEERIEVCSSCGFGEEPTFREETRVSFLETGEKPDRVPTYAYPGQLPQRNFYSRRRSVHQRVLVCLSCGSVHEVIETARA